jgi:hypothetical protein
MRDEGIASYYRDIARKQEEAYTRVDDAIEGGASNEEIKQLKQLAHDAGNTGD